MEMDLSYLSSCTLLVGVMPINQRSAFKVPCDRGTDFLEPYEGDEDRTPPYITFTTPADDAVGVDTSASLSITFNETISRGEGEVTITEAYN